jgi:hypothetical protein
MIASHPASFPFQSWPQQPDLPRFHLRARVCASNLVGACSISDMLSTTGPIAVDCMTLEPGKPPSWSIAVVVHLADQVYTN